MTAIILLTSIICGEVVVLIYEPDARSRAAAILWALASLSAGSLLGLIFGIPRAASEAPRAAENPDEPVRTNYHLRANTNMEQISDWLTKLLVGAGLVELRNFPNYIYSAAQFVAASLGTTANAAGATAFAAALLIYFFVEGFLGGYLATRMFFQNAFQRADEDLTAK